MALLTTEQIDKIIPLLMPITDDTNPNFEFGMPNLNSRKSFIGNKADRWAESLNPADN